ncbi:hypothetical protein R1sor_024817 [Riccia sorocarpa]|uniref:Uncharacterized protein n=1 Tax=Riccia sorocarpa TaxID=122646 RepID=A0ABD3GT59_9MARC
MAHTKGLSQGSENKTEALKEKRDIGEDDVAQTPQKRQKNNSKQKSMESKHIDEGEVNVDKLLDKILKERAKIDCVSGQFIFTEKELTAIGANSLEYLSSCYPFGLSMIIQVPVSKILSPTPVYGCRPFNESHMWDIVLSLRTKTAIIPQVADLLPVWIQKNVDCNGNDAVTETRRQLLTQEELKAALADPEIFFYAISGQHSAYAQNFLQGLPDVSESIKDNNKMRWSRILDGNARTVNLCKISHISNEQHVLTRYESSFIELMIQARNQWIHSGSPKPSGQGSKASNNYNGFMEIASLTLRRGGLREIQEILLAPDDVWQLFVNVADGWIKCKLAHPQGELSELVPEPGADNFCDVMSQLEKNRRKMKANWFKPFQGMETKDVKNILELLLKGKVLLRKAPNFEDPREDLQTFCSWMKTEDRLFDEIIRFFNHRFNIGVTRRELRKKYHLTRKILKEILSLLSEEHVAALKRNVKWKGVPPVLENKLTVLYREVTAGTVSKRLVPYSIIETSGDLVSSKLPLDVSSPDLVIADLTASLDWKQETFEGMFKVLFSLFPQCRDIKFVLVVYLLPSAVLDFLSSFLKFERLEPVITFKHFLGFYEPERRMDTTGLPVKGQGFIKGVVFVTAEGQEFPQCLEDRRITLDCRKPLDDKNYFLRHHEGPTEEQKRIWLCEHAPRWSMVERDDLRKKGRVHPHCKRADDIEDMVYNWSNYAGIIIDLFSGGVVLRAGLKASRQVISFARSSHEATFLESYVKKLKKYCISTKVWISKYQISEVNDQDNNDRSEDTEEVDRGHSENNDQCREKVHSFLIS